MKKIEPRLKAKDSYFITANNPGSSTSFRPVLRRPFSFFCMLGSRMLVFCTLEFFSKEPYILFQIWTVASRKPQSAKIRKNSLKYFNFFKKEYFAPIPAINDRVSAHQDRQSIKEHFEEYGFFPAYKIPYEELTLYPHEKKLLEMTPEEFNNLHTFKNLVPQQQVRDLWVEVKSF